jgi:hypothetical protein
MVKFSQPTPFVGIVNNARQRKLEKGTEVEVRAMKKSKYGPYALSFVEGRDKPVFLNPEHVDYVRDVTTERRAELDAERSAWVAEKDALVEIGPGELHPAGKSVKVGVAVDEECSDQFSTRWAFFPLSMISKTDDGYSAPPWLARIKAVDAVYHWVSQGGCKGVDHLGGAVLAAHYVGGPSYDIFTSDLHDAANRAAERG